MSLLSFSTNSIFKYDSLMINKAIRVVARNNRRPDYPMVVCRDVYSAIRNNTDHVLKSQVLGILHHSESQLPKFTDRTTVLLDMPESCTKGHKKQDLVKIATLGRWCQGRRGRCASLGQSIGLDYNWLKNRMYMKVYFQKSEIELVHSGLISYVANSCDGVSALIGEDARSLYFSKLVKSHLDAMIDFAYENISRKSATSSTEQMSEVSDLWVGIAGSGEYPNYTRMNYCEDLDALGLIILSKEVLKGAKRGFKLTHTRNSNTIYKMAFDAVAKSCNGSVPKRRDGFSRSTGGIEISKSLNIPALKLFNIGLDGHDL